MCRYLSVVSSLTLFYCRSPVRKPQSSPPKPAPSTSKSNVSAAASRSPAASRSSANVRSPATASTSKTIAASKSPAAASTPRNRTSSPSPPPLRVTRRNSPARLVKKQEPQTPVVTTSARLSRLTDSSHVSIHVLYIY